MLRENWFLKLKRMLVVATRRKSIVSISFSTEYLELLWAVQTWLVYTIWCVAIWGGVYQVPADAFYSYFVSNLYLMRSHLFCNCSYQT